MFSVLFKLCFVSLGQVDKSTATSLCQLVANSSDHHNIRNQHAGVTVNLFLIPNNAILHNAHNTHHNCTVASFISDAASL